MQYSKNKIQLQYWFPKQTRHFSKMKRHQFHPRIKNQAGVVAVGHCSKSMFAEGKVMFLLVSKSRRHTTHMTPMSRADNRRNGLHCSFPHYNWSSSLL